ncbi:MAG: hypothetical protein IKQ46_17945 [Bacteroidales bacterium]|nr:hypothetical protein [Bacteroidales bacterium]
MIKEYFHMNWGWGDNLTTCWYLAGVFECSDGYKINDGILTQDNIPHDKEYFQIHIATGIHPKK